MKTIDYVPWTVSATCVIGSLMLPSYSGVIWVTGLGLLLPLLWVEIRKPVNYESLKFDSNGFVFRRSGSVIAAKWSEVTAVYYCRSFCDFANQIDTEWQFERDSGDFLIVLVEWPQRTKFANAVIANLKQVSADAVREARAQRQEGRWSVVPEISPA